MPERAVSMTSEVFEVCHTLNVHDFRGYVGVDILVGDENRTQ